MKKKVGGVKPKKLSEVEIDYIKAILEKDCSKTLENIKNSIFDRCSKNVCVSTIANYIKKYNYSFKRLKCRNCKITFI